MLVPSVHIICDGSTTLFGLGLLYEVLRSQVAGHTSDQPDAETSTWQHTTLTTDIQTCPPAGFEHAIP